MPPRATVTTPRPTRLPNGLAVAAFLFMHVACLAALLTGVDGTALALCGACYLVRMFGITAGYHRYFSHRSYKTSLAFQFVLACLGCSALQKGPLWWAGHHRHHHRHSDDPEDLHSPRRGGFWWSHVGWIVSNRYDAVDEDRIKDFLKYPELRRLARFHLAPPLGRVSAGPLVGQVHEDHFMQQLAIDLAAELGRIYLDGADRFALTIEDVET